MTIKNNEIIKKINNKLHIYNIVYHPLKNKKIGFQKHIFKIINVLKLWNWGWYYALEITCLKGENINMFNKTYILVPYINQSCEENEIIEKIEYSQKNITMLK